jgi:hypothetical protein
MLLVHRDTWAGHRIARVEYQSSDASNRSPIFPFFPIVHQDDCNTTVECCVTEDKSKNPRLHAVEIIPMMSSAPLL